MRYACIRRLCCVDGDAVHSTVIGPEEQPGSTTGTESPTAQPTTGASDTTEVFATTAYDDMGGGGALDIRAQCTISLTQTTSASSLLSSSSASDGGAGASSPIPCGGLSTSFGRDTVLANVSTGFARQICHSQTVSSASGVATDIYMTVQPICTFGGLEGVHFCTAVCNLSKPDTPPVHAGSELVYRASADEDGIMMLCARCVCVNLLTPVRIYLDCCISPLT